MKTATVWLCVFALMALSPSVVRAGLYKDAKEAFEKGNLHLAVDKIFESARTDDGKKGDDVYELMEKVVRLSVTYFSSSPDLRDLIVSRYNALPEIPRTRINRRPALKQLLESIRQGGQTGAEQQGSAPPSATSAQPSLPPAPRPSAPSPAAAPSPPPGPVEVPPSEVTKPLGPKPGIAVMDFEAFQNVDPNVPGLVYDIVTQELLQSDLFNVISRAQRNKILEELKFQQTGVTDVNSAIEIGRQLNIEKMIFGKVNLIFGQYTLTLNLIDVKLAKVENSMEEKFGQSYDEVKSSTTRAIRKLVGIGWSASAGVEKDRYPDMVLIPAGEFKMGSRSGAGDEQPVHTVYVDAFYIDKHEVTNAEYHKFMEDTGFKAPKEWGNPALSRSNHPVVSVTWHEASSYCQWAGKRLPTEAEWEKAAKSADDRMYPWGNDPPDASGRFRANYDPGNLIEDGHKFTSPAGSFSNGATDFGIVDMSGNIQEWCADWYAPNYYTKSQGAKNPRGPASGTGKRVLRGGGFKDRLDRIRTTSRFGQEPDAKMPDNGFRCARNAGP